MAPLAPWQGEVAFSEDTEHWYPGVPLSRRF